MEDRFNTIAGWALGSGIVALGLSIVSGMYFEADKDHPPHEMGYVIEGVAAEGGAEEVPLATLLAAADIAKGESVFKKCTSCHTINSGGANGIGPNLFGVMGQPIGKHVAGFAYSSALSGHGGDWTFENMDAWLKSPKKFADGTKMTFAGLGKPEDRANLLAYLNAQGSNLPLPAAPAAEAAPAEGDAAAAASEGAAPAASEAAAPAAAASEAAPKQ
jgi:cytochrome c